MEDKIKTTISDWLKWFGYIEFGIGIIIYICGWIFFIPELRIGALIGMVSIFTLAFSKIVKAAEIYIGKNKNIIE